MTRCPSCKGILVENERVCYGCGDPIPGQSKSEVRPLALVILLAFIILLGSAAYFLRSSPSNFNFHQVLNSGFWR